MFDFLNRYGQWGLVLGSAEGIGAGYCEELAGKGMNLVMVDMDAGKLKTFADMIQKTYQVQVRQEVIDLSELDAADRCLQAIEGLDCRLMVYNAAYSKVKPFLAAGQHELDLYINVNTRTPLHIAWSFAHKLRSGNRPGGILLMASLAGLWGTRLVASYSGTKAFNLALAEALSHEFREHGIDVSAVCAGATATPGYLGTKPARGLFGPPLMQPRRVASIALNKIGKKTIIIPGLANRLNYFILTRILPRSLSTYIVNSVMAKTYRDPTF